MSRFIDKLNRLYRAEPQPIGFGAKQAASPKPKIQLVASLAQESADRLTTHLAGADAGLLRISQLTSGTKALQKMAQTVSDIPWGGWLQGSSSAELEQIGKIDCDFVAFPATNAPVVIIQNDEVGKILEVEASLSEGLLRAANELPIDAVLMATQQREGYFLTWQHLMLFQRSAGLLTKPLLVSVPSKVTSDELQALWEAGVTGVIVEVTADEPQDRLMELRQVIDKLAFPSRRKRERVEPLLPRIAREQSIVTTEEDEEEE